MNDFHNFFENNIKSFPNFFTQKALRLNFFKIKLKFIKQDAIKTQL